MPAADRHALGAGPQVAIPLEVLTPLEEFPLTPSSESATARAVDHRYSVLPLMRLGSYLGNGGSGEAELYLLPRGVVYSARGRSVALLVNGIVDIVSAVGSHPQRH